MRRVVTVASCINCACIDRPIYKEFIDPDLHDSRLGMIRATVSYFPCRWVSTGGF